MDVSNSRLEAAPGERPAAYEVKLDVFEGPLDLLLHLIHKNEMDIFDIPIATITDQYLQYIEMMKAFNMSVAGDFLVMASTLVHIKSKMLLPRPEGETEEEDPRTEIVRPLMEYMQIKDAARELSERDMLERDVFPRPDLSTLRDLLDLPDPGFQVNLFQLMDAFHRLLQKRAPEVSLTVQLEAWSVKEKVQMILARLRQATDLFFEDLFVEDQTPSNLVVTFLALLELVHMGLARIFQLQAEGPIRVEACFDGDEAGAEELDGTAFEAYH